MRPEPFAFHCQTCNQSRANPLAVQPVDGFISVYNWIEQRKCDDCLRISEKSFFSRELRGVCCAMTRDGRACIVDTDEHAGVEHRFREPGPSDIGKEKP